MPNDDLPESFLELVPKEVMGESGAVLLSGRRAFSSPSSVYLLGLNPGGEAESHKKYTIERDIADWRNLPDLYSSYEPGGQKGAAWERFSNRVVYLLKSMRYDPRIVPASNVIFTRSQNRRLLGDYSCVIEKCWRVHEAIIASLGVKVILCLGKDAGHFVRSQLRANAEGADPFIEDNRRKWRSEAHVNETGQWVVTLTHPSRADWTKPATDPTPLVKYVLASAGVTS